MCVALPTRVVQVLDRSRIVVQQHGRMFEVGAHLVPGVGVGDYVLLNLGMAVKQLREEEAREILHLWQQIGGTLSRDAETTGEETDAE